MPPSRFDIAVQRILVRHGFSRGLSELLLEDLKAVSQANRLVITEFLSLEKANQSASNLGSAEQRCGVCGKRGSWLQEKSESSGVLIIGVEKRRKFTRLPSNIRF
jgi:hypothetical protein